METYEMMKMIMMGMNLGVMFILIYCFFQDRTGVTRNKKGYGRLLHCGLFVLATDILLGFVIPIIMDSYFTIYFYFKYREA